MKKFLLLVLFLGSIVSDMNASSKKKTPIATHESTESKGSPIKN